MRDWLPRGKGRSYGDVCLNDGGGLILTERLDRFIEFDTQRGSLICESGVCLSEIIKLVLPRGWFPAVTPGTQFVTVGGAVANDVHGKNHHRAGCFGNHVLGLELVRSDGTRIQCSPAQHPGWFAATIGGLGLTGLITTVELKLRPVPGPWILQESLPFGSIREFLALSEESEQSHDYVVAWVDCLAQHRSVGRGVLFRGNHLEATPARRYRHRTLSVPLTPPVPLITSPVIRAFNFVYRNTSGRRRSPFAVHYQPFFYPLDSVLNWNRLYGRNGFQQYQCVIPPGAEEPAIEEMLSRIAQARTGSFLAVLKRFGDIRSPGMCSFPRCGTTLALDFPMRGEPTSRLFAVLDDIVEAAGGLLYPAKDGNVSRRPGRRLLPDFERLRPFVDPAISSGFWRRVQGDGR